VLATYDLKMGLDISEHNKYISIVAIGTRAHRRPPVEAPARDDPFEKTLGVGWVWPSFQRTRSEEQRGRFVGGSGQAGFECKSLKADVPLLRRLEPMVAGTVFRLGFEQSDVNFDVSLSADCDASDRGASLISFNVPALYMENCTRSFA
jgi:hypothetical protein